MVRSPQLFLLLTNAFHHRMATIFASCATNLLISSGNVLCWGLERVDRSPLLVGAIIASPGTTFCGGGIKSGGGWCGVACWLDTGSEHFSLLPPCQTFLAASSRVVSTLVNGVQACTLAQGGYSYPHPLLALPTSLTSLLERRCHFSQPPSNVPPGVDLLLHSCRSQSPPLG